MEQPKKTAPLFADVVDAMRLVPTDAEIRHMAAIGYRLAADNMHRIADALTRQAERETGGKEVNPLEFINNRLQEKRATPPPAPAPAKRKMSAAGRKAIALAQRKRLADYKKSGGIKGVQG